MSVRRNYNTQHKQPIYSTDGNFIGSIRGLVFKKKINGSKHLLHSPPAIAIDSYAFDTHILSKCQSIEVIDSETGTKYNTSSETFSNYMFKFNRRYGEQYALPLRYWDYEGKPVSTKREQQKPDTSPQLRFVLEGL